MLHLSLTPILSYLLVVIVTMSVLCSANSLNSASGTGSVSGSSDEQQTGNINSAGNGKGNFYHYLTDSGSMVEFENARLLPSSAAENSARMLNPIVSSPLFGSMVFRPSALSLGNAAGMSAEHRIVTRGGKQRFCGEMLVSALALVCKGNYRKRSSSFANGGAPEMADYGYPSSENPSSSNTGTYLDFFDVLKGASRSSGNGNGQELKALRLASKRGVVDDCCKKPCSTSTLGLYCSI